LSDTTLGGIPPLAGGTVLAVSESEMRRNKPLLLVLLMGLSAIGLAGEPAPATPASAGEHEAVERFLSETEKPPVAYHARRRLEASSSKLNESAWMEVITQFEPASGFRYSIVAQGGSERIQRRVLTSVLQAEQENSVSEVWRTANLSRANYQFDFSGRTADGMLRMQLNPRRRDSRLVNGAALLTASSGDLVRVEGRLAKSPSIWVRWAHVSRSYSPVGGSMMPVAVESTADVRFAGLSTFAMTYDYQMVDGHAVNGAPRVLASR
jgi:hypothetical protein